MSKGKADYNGFRVKVQPRQKENANNEFEQLKY